MKKVVSLAFRKIGLTISIVAQIALFIISLLIIFGVSYIVGYKYLIGNVLPGNDAYSFYLITEWIHRFFPRVPFWYPLAGGGISFAGYPYFAAYLVNILEYFTSLDLPQSFRFLGFVSAPLTGVGIFLFAWSRLTSIKPIWMREIIGLTAALFYVVSPVSWFWLTKWGFYAEQVSLIFVPLTILFFDIYLERLIARKFDFVFRIALLGTMVFWILGFLCHFFAGVSVIIVFLALGLARFLVEKEKKLVLVRQLIVPIVLFGVIFAGLFIFRYYSYSSYTKAVEDGGFGGPATAESDRNGVVRSSLTEKMTLSLEDPEEHITDWRFQIKDMRFPFYVWLLLVPSLFFGYLKSRKIFVFSLLALIGFLINTNPDRLIFVSQIPIIGQIPLINKLPGFLTGRMFFVAGRIYIPLAAAFGAYILWEIIGSIFLEFTKKIKIAYYTLLPLKISIVFVLTIFTAGLVVFKYYHLPYARYTLNAGGFDGYVVDSSSKEHIVKIDLRDIWGRAARPDAIGTGTYTKEEEEFIRTNPEYFSTGDFIYLHYLCTFDAPKGMLAITDSPDHICSRYNTPKVSIFPPISLVRSERAKCNSMLGAEYIGEKRHCRAFYPDSLAQLSFSHWKPFTISSDISGELKGTKGLFEKLPKDKEYRYDLSGFVGKSIMIAPFINDNSLIQTYIGTLSLIYNIWNYQAQVMYTTYPVYQQPGVLTELAKWFGLDYVFLAGPPFEPHAYWAQDENWSGSGSAGWKEFKKPTGLTTWDNRPRMLVISDQKKLLYDQTFKFFSQGGLLYDQAIPINGGSTVDAYSLKELKNYDIIFMRGYSYNFRWRAHRLLDDYVRSGGKLIFDTGWQYFVPDYELSSAPSFMPFYDLDWKNLPTNSSFIVEDKEIVGDVRSEKFGPLIYEDGPWGVSVPSKLRTWAKPVLSYDGKPLVVVGKYGKGKVAWIGFNIIPHSEAKASKEEVRFFNKLVLYINNDFSDLEVYDISKRRIDPDRVEFTLHKSFNKPSNLYFRESYYPDWRAKLISSNGKKDLEITKAGPGFMLVQLPSVNAGDKVELFIRSSFMQVFLDVVSGLTFLLLVLYVISPRFVTTYPTAFITRLNITKHIKTLHQHKLIREKIANATKSWNRGEDEDY